jgi:hypothetical protein
MHPDHGEFACEAIAGPGHFADRNSKEIDRDYRLPECFFDPLSFSQIEFRSRAFSEEVDTGSCKENSVNQ